MGSHSERQSTWPPPAGQLPVSALVLPASTCARSGKLRVRSALPGLLPNDDDAVPKTRNSGPAVLGWASSPVPVAEPLRSVCSQT